MNRFSKSTIKFISDLRDSKKNEKILLKIIREPVTITFD